MKVKICCISSLKEAELATDAGAYALGLVGPMPSGPGVIADDQIQTIAATFRDQVKTFLLTSETQAEKIIQHHQRTQTTTIQLVDSVQSGTYAKIRKALPGIELVQVIHVLDARSVDEALAAAEEVDAILLDSGNPNLQVKELGGTGRTHDWSISRQIVEQAGIPVFLAGGLNPVNVREAIDQVQPFGLDLCSGVRTNGALDPAKLEAFFNSIL